MSRDITEVIDDYCFAEYGHTDWEILDELSFQERLQKKYKVKTFSSREVVFYVKEKA
tara:strand:- start:6067 stop:6237 length:171 start_codon:yes stop_codon:yes gene_type:complete